MSDPDPGCQNKLPFATKEAAEGAATTAQHKYGGTKPSVYQCDGCGQWHLASNYDGENNT